MSKTTENLFKILYVGAWCAYVYWLMKPVKNEYRGNKKGTIKVNVVTSHKSGFVNRFQFTFGALENPEGKLEYTTTSHALVVEGLRVPDSFIVKQAIEKYAYRLGSVIKNGLTEAEGLAMACARVYVAQALANYFKDEKDFSIRKFEFILE